MSQVTLSGSSELLALAYGALDGDLNIPERRRSRAAALLGRRALEELAVAIPLADGIDLSDATMRSTLICLRHLSDPSVGRPLADPSVAQAAVVAWHGLSNVCHHHAYELTPTSVEVRRLLDMVRVLEEQVDRSAVFGTAG